MVSAVSERPARPTQLCPTLQPDQAAHRGVGLPPKGISSAVKVLPQGLARLSRCSGARRDQSAVEIRASLEIHAVPSRLRFSEIVLVGEARQELATRPPALMRPRAGAVTGYNSDLA